MESGSRVAPARRGWPPPARRGVDFGLGLGGVTATGWYGEGGVLWWGRGGERRGPPFASTVRSDPTVWRGLARHAALVPGREGSDVIRFPNPTRRAKRRGKERRKCKYFS